MENTQKTEKKTTKPKNKGGRPTKYRPIFAKKLLEYCNKPPFVEKEITFTNGFGIKVTKTIIEANDLPMIEEFADQIGVSDPTCVAWAKATKKNGDPKYPEFFAAYTKLKSVQKLFLTRNGLRGLYKENYSMFVSQNFTDMRQKIEHSGDQEKPMLVKITDFSNATDLTKRRNPPAA